LETSAVNAVCAVWSARYDDICGILAVSSAQRNGNSWKLSVDYMAGGEIILSMLINVPFLGIVLLNNHQFLLQVWMLFGCRFLHIFQ